MSVNGELVQTDYLIGEILHTVIGFTPCDLRGKSRIMWNCLGVSFENPPFEVESANLDCITSGRERGHLVESISRAHANLDVMHALKFVSTGSTPSMVSQQQRTND